MNLVKNQNNIIYLGIFVAFARWFMFCLGSLVIFFIFIFIPFRGVVPRSRSSGRCPFFRFTLRWFFFIRHIITCKRHGDINEFQYCSYEPPVFSGLFKFSPNSSQGASRTTTRVLLTLAGDSVAKPLAD